MTPPETPNPTVARLEGITPILYVRNLQSSIDHYVTVLGFRVDWHAPGQVASMSRDSAQLMLAEGDQGHPGSWVWLTVNDAALLHDEWRAKGATIRLPPTDYPWAFELQVEDLDSNVLRLGSEPRHDRPIGEWIDMRGERWVKSPSGQWTRVTPG